MTVTKIYLVRHAEAEGNLYRRIHGQFDTNVTPNGRRQIAALARRFAAVPVVYRRPAAPPVRCHWHCSVTPILPHSSTRWN